MQRQFPLGRCDVVLHALGFVRRETIDPMASSVP
jgi:hypothetical protein